MAVIPGVLGGALHAVSAYNLLDSPTGINLGIFPMLALVSFLMMIASVCLSIKQPTESLMALVYPTSSVLLWLSLTFESQYQPREALSFGILSHIFFSILAYSALAIAFVQSLIVYGQNRQLKTRQLNGVVKILPPLQLMEQILFGLIAIGFGLLTLAITTGIIYLDNIFAQQVAHKTFFSLIAWGIFFGLMTGRYRLGWRGFTAARWTMGGFCVLLVGFIGTKFVLEILLQ